MNTLQRLLTDGLLCSGFKTEYPAKEDGTAAEVVMASQNSDVTLTCDTFPISGEFLRFT